LEKILSQESTRQQAIQEELYQVEKGGKKHGCPPPSLGGIHALLSFVRHGNTLNVPSWNIIMCILYISSFGSSD
jgi:hypothetical protein